MTTAPSALTSSFDDSWESFLTDSWGDLDTAGGEGGRSAVQDREAAWLEDVLLISDFSAMPLRRLRAMANRLYLMLDAGFPPAGALERYETVTEELTLRAAKTQDRTTVRH
jgi:hypothetical protein